VRRMMKGSFDSLLKYTERPKNLEVLSLSVRCLALKAKSDLVDFTAGK
jgi:hypothetical protein